MIDLHCHLLPSVDDGAADLDAALAMADVLVAVGFTIVAASPHMGTGPGGDVSRSRAEAARAILDGELTRRGVGLRVLPNAEHHVSGELFERLAAGDGVPVG